MKDLIKAIDGLPKIVRFFRYTNLGNFSEYLSFMSFNCQARCIRSRFINHFIAMRWILYSLDY